jgi:rhodanese-related sulfurtransferase
MRQYFPVLFCLLLVQSAMAQYKNDNVLFKTVYPENLKKELEKNQGYILIDVRSPGEYSDTSSSTGLNIGHLKNAVNMDIRQIGGRLSEIAGYKDKPVFVYCSHSQRSRRVSKLLADSGFLHVYNINGGMTAIQSMPEADKKSLSTYLVNANSYNILAPSDVCEKLSAPNNIFLLDVRPDSVWNASGSNAKFNAYGYLKGSRHIALADLKNNLSALPRNKNIVITDLSGGEAALAARSLKESGFENVSVMVEGMDRWLYSDKSKWPCKDLYQSKAAFKIISTPEFAAAQKNTPAFLLDIRTTEEFTNQHKDAFRNIGYFKNGKNIPNAELAKRIAELKGNENKPIVVYAFSNSTEAYEAANTLVKNGFKNVSVLAGGLFNVRWTAANVSGYGYLKDWVEGVPEENK